MKIKGQKGKMMISRILLLILFLIGFNLADEEKKWGEVDSEFMTMTIYPEDTSAAAIKIFDIGLIDVSLTSNYNVQMVFKRHFQTKILKERGKSYADISISYWHEDHVSEIKAQTILPSGEKIKLDNDKIFDEKSKKQFRVKKFAMPNVEVGSILEVNYTLESEYLYELEPWYFHDNVPVVESEIIIKLVPFFSYYVKFGNDPQGLIKHTKEKYYNRDFEKWMERNKYRATNLPAIKREPFISSLKNYRARIDFQIEGVRTPTYHKVYIKDIQTLSNNLLEGKYGSFMKPAGKVKKLVKELISENMSNDEKARRLYQYVRDNLEESYDSGISVLKEQEEILEKKKASDSEKNLLLMAMLKAAGFEVKPVLISTRDHGLVNPEIPFLSQYNKTILVVNIDGNYYLFDARDPWLTYGQLPPSSLVKNAMLIEKDNNFYMEIPNVGLRSYEIIESSIQVLPDGELKGSSQILAIGYASSKNNRLLYKHKTMDKMIKEEITEHLDGYCVTGFDTTLEAAPSDTFNTSFSFDLENFAEIIDDEIYLKPGIYFSENKNVFVSEKRAFPVEYEYRSKSIETNTFILPPNYEVAELPKEIIIENNYIKYQRTLLIMEQNPLTIGFSRQFEIKELVVPTEEYTLLKNDYSKIVDADQEMIVIKSK